MKKIRYFALDKNVLVVAVEGSIGDWSAYIGAVKGERHSVEYLEVKDNGTKLTKAIAEILFPDFMNFRWRE